MPTESGWAGLWGGGVRLRDLIASSAADVLICANTDTVEHYTMTPMPTARRLKPTTAAPQIHPGQKTKSPENTHDTYCFASGQKNVGIARAGRLEVLKPTVSASRQNKRASQYKKWRELTSRSMAATVNFFSVCILKHLSPMLFIGKHIGKVVSCVSRLAAPAMTTATIMAYMNDWVFVINLNNPYSVGLAITSYLFLWMVFALLYEGVPLLLKRKPDP